jgi:hypothetical protein
MLTLLLAAAAAASVPADLAAAVRAYDKAQVEGNRAELERWLADDYLLVNSSGATETKAQLVADYTASGFKLEPFTIEQPVEKVWGDGAVMGGIATLKGMDSGRPFAMRLRFADIWAKRSGRWQVIYTQVAKAP